jgi:diaminopropionate ammonia-lyase
MILLRERAATPQATAEPPSPFAFHRSLPGYRRTPLVEARRAAAELGLAQLLVKDESTRAGLPSFKILGASWAIARAVAAQAGTAVPASLDELRALAAPLRPLTLAAATDGNHGRAVARVARLLDLAARIFVPAGTAQARIDAIAAEGAAVEVVDGSYDQTVARSAREADARCFVISDTSWPGYEQVPRWVIDGYATIGAEIDAELRTRGESRPDVILVQIGVGALAAAIVRHFRAAGTRLVGVEPTRAACVLESIRAGRLLTLPGQQDSIMAGLNCGTPSIVAWPDVSTGIDAYLAIDDERAREAMRMLARDDVVAGETGAAGLGGLLELVEAAPAAEARERLPIDNHTRVLVLCTEGATDPEAYSRIIGQAE